MAIVMDILLGAWVFVLSAVIWNKIDELCESIRGRDEVELEDDREEDEYDELSDM